MPVDKKNSAKPSQPPQTKKTKKESIAPARQEAQNNKLRSLDVHREDATGEFLTTNQGLRINDNQNSLKSGERGSTLLEDFILREKITHFDHERIPERIVHARGSAAHGFFQVYESMATYTKAGFLQDPTKKIPVFVRFSTVAGSRGSSDLARDVRGFAVKFYTDEGNYDLVGNNMPVFFIQDAIKFPDLIHAVKPEPHHEMPQAASAHDTFWDFISLMPEALHMILWVMSDRALPRSYRMMEGFGVHTFRFVNEAGKSRFVKFHWKPLLGVHSITWDEAQQISGKDPDFHRRDLWEAIENGDFPEWELGVQMVDEKDEHKFDFDLLDPTKLIPEELVPVKKIGKMTLNRNPDNFFSETEQVAFHPGHIVPGIDFTNDPLLQGRLFSYTDTQLKRLGSPNFHEIPINRPIAPLHNNQRDGHMRQMIHKGRVSYEPNSLGGGCPMQAGRDMEGFVSYAEKIDSTKVRARSASFFDHFSQAKLFFDSQSQPEQDHIIKALRFELGKVEVEEVRARMLILLSQVDQTLASRVAQGLGMKVPTTPSSPLNHSVPADGNPKDFQSKPIKKPLPPSQALSMKHTVKDTIQTRKIAALVSDGVDDDQLNSMKQSIEKAGAQFKIIAPQGGAIHSKNGNEIIVDHALFTTASVFFDAIYLPGGHESVQTLLKEDDALKFVAEAYKHCKAIAATGEGVELLGAAPLPFKEDDADKGLFVDAGDSEGRLKKIIPDFIKAIAQHRVWEREEKLK